MFVSVMNVIAMTAMLFSVSFTLFYFIWYMMDKLNKEKWCDGWVWIFIWVLICLVITLYLW